MRTIIELDETLSEAAKRAAEADGKSLNALVEEALGDFLLRRRRPLASRSSDLPVFRGDGVRAGVDLAKNAAVRDTLERTD